MLKGFKNILMQGNLVIIAVGLVIALAFSTLVSAFTTNDHHSTHQRARRNVVRRTPASAGQSTASSSRWARSSVAVIYFIIFMFVVYFVLVVPYRRYMSKRGVTSSPRPLRPPTKTCPNVSAAIFPLRPRNASTARASSTDRRSPPN